MTKILKANTYGTIEVAISDTDYASVATETKIAGEAQISVDSAALSAGAAALSATEAESSVLVAQVHAGLAAGSLVVALGARDLAVGSVSSIKNDVLFFLLPSLAKLGYEEGKVIYYSTKAINYSIQVDKDYNYIKEVLKTAGIRLIIKDFSAVAGAAGAAGITTLLIDSDVELSGDQVTNISQSPQDDHDAISAKFYWDLFNDNVELKWL